MFNLKGLLENVIAEAIEDSQESIPTDKLPSALLIAKRIEELEKALQFMVDRFEDTEDRFSQRLAISKAKKVLAQS